MSGGVRARGRRKPKGDDRGAARRAPERADRAGTGSSAESPARPRAKVRRAENRPGASGAPRSAASSIGASCCVLWCVIGAAAGVAWVGAHLPPIQSLEVPKRPPSIQIVGMTGACWRRAARCGGAAVPLADLPAHLPQAFLAIEDRRFYEHYGVDPIGHRARGRRPTSCAAASSQGGSTHHAAAREEPVSDAGAHARRASSRKSCSRSGSSANSPRRRSSNSISTASISAPAPTASKRPRSAISASRREQADARRSGDARRPRQVAVAACADPQSRRRASSARRSCSPRWPMPASSADKQAKHRDGRTRRRRSQRNSAGSVNYVADWVMDVLDDLRRPRRRRHRRRTTIDPHLQAAAEKALVDELARRARRSASSQGALVAMTPDGAVRALVGGRNYADSQFNRAVAAKRQPGSAFKPFVYLAALERGLTPDTVREDEPIALQGLEAGKLHARIFRPGHADAGARACRSTPSRCG